MPTGPSYGTDDIFTQARAMLNDFGAETFVNSKLIVYAQMAWEQIAMKMSHAGLPALFIQAKIVVSAGTTVLNYVTFPSLPSDLLTPIFIEESPTGRNEWIPMTELRLGHNADTAVADRTETLRVWTWRGQALQLAGSTQTRDILIHYFRGEPEIVDPTTNLGRIIANSRGYMSRKTAGYAALFMMQDMERAAALNDEAMDFLDMAIGIATNQSQSMPVRRRAYGSSRRRGMWYPKTS